MSLPTRRLSLISFPPCAGEARLECDLMDGYESIAVIAAAEESARVGGFIACERRVPVDF